MLIVCAVVRIGIVVVIVVIVVFMRVHRREHARLLLPAFSFPAKREPNSPFTFPATGAMQLLLLVRLQSGNRLSSDVSAAAAAACSRMHLSASPAERRRVLRRRGGRLAHLQIGSTVRMRVVVPKEARQAASRV